MCRVLAWLLGVTLSINAWAGEPIMGARQVQVHDMWLFVSSHNPDFDPEIAQAFATLGDQYGIRGDVALCQAVIETGWFGYQGSAVTAEDHNYCGLGVHTNGEKGCGFESVEQGVRAMLQHLYAYASKDELPKGEQVVDPRFSYVRRGSAESWEDLAGKWAANPEYARQILSLYQKMVEYSR